MKKQSEFFGYKMMEKLPTIKSKTEALKEIIKIANNKQSHLLLEDCVDWLNYKMRAIKIIAKRGLGAKRIKEGK